MNPLEVQKVSDKTHGHSVTAENQSTLLLTDTELQLNTNVDKEQVSENLKIKKLNHDCLAQVLMHLSVLDRLEMEKVCKKWKEATKMSSYNIKKLNFNDLKITLDKRNKTWKIILKKYGRYLTHLTITYAYPWICDVIRNECQNIIYFDIYADENCRHVSNKNLLQLVTSMTKLKYFKITSVNKSSDFFTQLLEQLSNDIEEIHLESICDIIISVVPDKFKSLRCLTLQRFRLDQSIMDLISLNSNTLVHLDLYFCNSSPDVSVFSKLCNLEFLNLAWIENLDTNIINTIARNCPKLNHLEWKSSIDICERQIVPYRDLKYLNNLEYVYIEEIKISKDDESILSEIANNCKKLKHLDFGYWSLLSTSVVKEIKKFRNLELLNLGLTTIDSQSLIEIADNCVELRQLLIYFKNVDESAIEKLTNLKKLENLYFSDCNNLTGDLLIKIVNSCKYLKDVKINNCKNVTEASLIQVAKLEFLEELNIDNTVNVPIGMFNYLHNLKVQSKCN